jgi:hypothetical protein
MLRKKDCKNSIVSFMMFIFIGSIASQDVEAKLVSESGESHNSSTVDGKNLNLKNTNDSALLQINTYFKDTEKSVRMVIHF